MPSAYRTISTWDDVIDSRDVIARIEELESEETLDDTDARELASLKAFRDDVAPYCADWEYGEAIIREGYFKRYAIDFAYDIGAVKEDASWPNNCIDWDAAARTLQMDYTSAEFDGVTYWFRRHTP